MGEWWSTGSSDPWTLARQRLAFELCKAESSMGGLGMDVQIRDPESIRVFRKRADEQRVAVGRCGSASGSGEVFETA